ncbi:helix-turn-helix transcriptional regulator [Nocardia brasiliensis]|nr:helix-turn-helix transcriptional regulator [Nocardia brasiliensis]MBF6547312.1 helix-turn-helix transcriptional regulator [Nocardia brasiliensis]
MDVTCKHLLAYSEGVSEGTDSAEVFKALADPTRRVILDELAERDGQTLFELCGRLTMRHGMSSSRQAISQHLEVLAVAGLVTASREGRYKFHYLNREPLRNLTDRWTKE